MTRPYTPVSIPTPIVREIKKRIRPGGDLARFRSHSEFIIATVRETLEQRVPLKLSEVPSAP